MPNWKKVIISGSDAALNSLEITSHLTASGLIYPTSDGTDGQALTTDGAGNLTFGNPGLADEAEKVTFEVQNGDTGTLAKGTPVHITSMTGGTAIVVAASASVASKMPSHGILNQQLTVGSDGFATILGQVTGVNTSAFSPGDTVYVGPFGGYTNVKPTGSTNLIQNLGVVKIVDASNGTGEIFGSGRTNDVPNLPEGKIWVGDGYTVTSSVVHLDEPNSRLGIGTSSPLAKTHIRASNSGATAVADGTLIIEQGSSPAIQILSANSQTQTIKFGDPQDGDVGRITYAHPTDDMAFFTDGTQKMTISGSGNVGIGTTTPNQALDILGSANISGSLIIDNPSYSGTHTIQQSANNQFQFINSGIGGYMTVGGGNTVEINSQRLKSLGRGLELDATISSTPLQVGTAGVGTGKGLTVLNSASNYNVGIGSNAPTAKLNIVGNGTTSATTALLVEDSSGSDLLKVNDDGFIYGTSTVKFGHSLHIERSGPSVSFKTTDNAVASGLVFQNSGGSTTARIYHTPDTGKIDFWPSNGGSKMNLTTAGLELTGSLVADGDVTATGTGSFSDGRFSGNVGIGSTSPDEKLVVAGTIRSAGGGNIQTDRNFVLAPFGFKGGIYADQLLTGNPSDSLNDIVLYSAFGSIHLTEGATTNKVLTVSGSSVGIGTTTPGYKLDVHGDANITGSLTITGSTNLNDVSGSFSGSFEGDGSGLTGVTGEWDGTLNGDAEITGSLTVKSGEFLVSGSTNTGITSDGEIVLGYGNQPVALSRTLLTEVDTGPPTVVASVPSFAFLSVHFDYVIVKGTNLRAGTVIACHDGSSNVVYAENSTADLGSTAGVTLAVVETGGVFGNLELQMTVPSDDWYIKCFVRGI